jgi:hypothetical protein
LPLILASKQKDIDQRYHEPNSYWKYILPDELIKLQRGREGLGLNHHDEHLFIVVHQAFELWFKQVRASICSTELGLIWMQPDLV